MEGELIMNRMIRTTCALLGIGCGILSMGCNGGERYRNLVDPCQFERYTSTARQEAIAGFAPQVANGRVLDQTIWNYHFESGTDKLNPSGLDKLDQIVRRRPEPDSQLFLATARDLPYSAESPDKYPDDQAKLNRSRAASIQKYLAAQTASRPMQFDILVHDPADSSLPGVSARTTIVQQRTSYSGSLTGGGVGGGGGGGGGSSFGGTGVGMNNQGSGQQGGGGGGGGYGNSGPR